MQERLHWAGRSQMEERCYFPRFTSGRWCWGGGWEKAQPCRRHLRCLCPVMRRREPQANNGNPNMDQPRLTYFSIFLWNTHSGLPISQLFFSFSLVGYVFVVTQTEHLEHKSRLWSTQDGCCTDFSAYMKTRFLQFLVQRAPITEKRRGCWLKIWRLIFLWH